MTPSEQWREEMERMQAEQAAYASRAKFQRAEATRCRERRDWLGALQADTRAREYRKTRDDYASRAKEIKNIWAATWRKTPKISTQPPAVLNTPTNGAE